MPLAPTPQELEQIDMIRKLDPKLLDQVKDEEGNFDSEKMEQLISKLETQSQQSAEVGQNSEQMARSLENMHEVFQETEQVGEISPIARSLPYNHKKAQAEWQNQPGADLSEIGANQLEEQRSLESENPTNLFFVDYASLRDWLQQRDFNSSYHMLSQLVDTDHDITINGVREDTLQVLQDSLKSFYETPQEDTDNRLEFAKMAFESLPDAVKAQGENFTNIVEAPYTEANIMDYKKHIKTLVEETGKSIAEAAKKAGSKKRASSKKPFNLHKTAQHQTQENTILWNAGEKRIDPFYMQPVSDWHIVERNKGFGQDIDGNWDIDWEAIWRGTVMDKYSRPYKDTETGEWVGGYIQKRFEVDKWIPEDTNLQLLPGERRRPYLPQYKSLESRLQHMRSKDERGYGPTTDTSEPFNWREANSNKLTKESQGVSPDAFVPDLQPGDRDLHSMSADKIVSFMSPENKSQFLSAYESGQWGDVYYLLGETDHMSEFNKQQLADNVYMKLKNNLPDNMDNTEPQRGSASELASTASKKKVM